MLLSDVAGLMRTPASLMQLAVLLAGVNFPDELSRPFTKICWLVRIFMADVIGQLNN